MKVDFECSIRVAELKNISERFLRRLALSLKDNTRSWVQVVSIPVFVKRFLTWSAWIKRRLARSIGHQIPLRCRQHVGQLKINGTLTRIEHQTKLPLLLFVNQTVKLLLLRIKPMGRYSSRSKPSDLSTLRDVRLIIVQPAFGRLNYRCHRIRASSRGTATPLR